MKVLLYWQAKVGEEKCEFYLTKHTRSNPDPSSAASTSGAFLGARWQLHIAAHHLLPHCWPHRQQKNSLPGHTLWHMVSSTIISPQMAFGSTNASLQCFSNPPWHMTNSSLWETLHSKVGGMQPVKPYCHCGWISANAGPGTCLEGCCPALEQEK